MYLLDAPGPRLSSQIRDALEAYQGLTDAAFSRMFERDKSLLRSLGVPLRSVEVPQTEAGIGYQLDADDFELPPVEFTAAEAMMVELAARTWEEHQLAAPAAGGLVKLQTAGVAAQLGTETAVPRPTMGEPGFDVLWEALFDRRRVTFHYRDTDRVVQPWRLVTRHGRSYLVGLDEVRQAPRVFKLARMSQGPRVVGPRGAVTVPDRGTVDGAVQRLLTPDAPESSALVAVRQGRQGTLTRAAEPAPSPKLDLPADFATWRIQHGALDRFAADLAAAGADVIVLEPAELRRAVVAQLQEVAQ